MKIFHVAKVVQHEHLMKTFFVCVQHALAPLVLLKSDLGIKDFMTLVRTEDLQCLCNLGRWEPKAPRS